MQNLGTKAILPSESVVLRKQMTCEDYVTTHEVRTGVLYFLKNEMSI